MEIIITEVGNKDSEFRFKADADFRETHDLERWYQFSAVGYGPTEATAEKNLRKALSRLIQQAASAH